MLLQTRACCCAYFFLLLLFCLNASLFLYLCTVFRRTVLPLLLICLEICLRVTAIDNLLCGRKSRLVDGIEGTIIIDGTGSTCFVQILVPALGSIERTLHLLFFGLVIRLRVAVLVLEGCQETVSWCFESKVRC